MMDDKLGVWHLPYLFMDVQALLVASAWNTEYKAPSSFMSRLVNMLLSFS